MWRISGTKQSLFKSNKSILSLGIFNSFMASYYHLTPLSLFEVGSKHSESWTVRNGGILNTYLLYNCTNSIEYSCCNRNIHSVLHFYVDEVVCAVKTIKYFQFQKTSSNKTLKEVACNLGLRIKREIEFFLLKEMKLCFSYSNFFQKMNRED